MIYKGDFLRGNASACSIAAQGLWFRLMLLMHDSERTGYLCLNGSPILSRVAAVKCAVSVDEYDALLAELMSVSAFSTSADGILFSPQLVSEAEARAGNAARQRKHYDKKKTEKPNGDLTANLTATSHDKPSSTSTSKSFSSSDEKEKENGGGGNAHAHTHTRGKPPPAAAIFTDFPKNRLWIELDEREKSMEFAEFATHLQTLRPKQNVRKIAEKLRAFCKTKGVDFSHERLKGWVFGEGKAVSDADFLTAFGDAPEEKPPSFVELCPDCDSRGFVTVKIEGVERNTKCRHKKVKEKAK